MDNNKHDFAVELEEIYTAGTGGMRGVPGRKAVIRQDTRDVLGVVSNNYVLLSHGQVVDSFRRALEGYDYTEKIQLAKNGAHMFATYKLNTVQVEVKKGDIVSLQFIVKNSYDGSSTLQIMLGAYRLVCSNGMVVGKQFFSFSQRHVGGNTQIKIDAIQGKVLALADQFRNMLPRLQQMGNTLMPFDVNDPMMDQYFDPKVVKVVPSYLLAEAFGEYMKAKDYTVWGYYNALTFAVTHRMKKQSPVAAVNYGKAAWGLAQKVLA